MNTSSATSTMVRPFTTSKTRFVDHLGFSEIVSFLGEGVGGALYILGQVTEQRLIAALGVLCVIGAVVSLMMHLGVRAHLAWRAITRIKTSWVSRGTLFMGLFMACSILSFAAAYIDGLKPFENSLASAALVLAALVIIYAGMMLRSMKAVTLWHSLYVPLAFSLHSITTASLVILALAPWTGLDVGRIQWLQPLAAACLLLSALASVLHLMLAKRSAGIQASKERLFSGMLRGKLMWGAGFSGIIVPLAGLIISWLGAATIGIAIQSIILAGVAICRLYGDYAYRSVVVSAGAYEPIVPPPSR